MKIHKLLAALGAVLTAFSATAAPFILTSPDGKISAEITAGKNLKYSVSYNGQTLMQPSEIGMTLTDGTVVGSGKAKVIKRTSVDEMVKTPVYRHDKIRDHYNGLTLSLGKQWRVEFRAYNDGVAYRFVTTAAKPLRVEDETAEYTFSGDVPAIAPYVRARHKKPDFESQFFSSFENIYTTTNVDGLDPGKLIFLPMAVEPAPDVKVLITESDLEGYPGMYLNRSDSGKRSGVWAPYPKMRQQGGHNNLQMLVQERWPYIADSKGARSFPWRIMVIGDDKTLATSDLSYLLGKPPRIADTSWIKPGKVAWDWWNAWNIRNVDFKSGINNDTYNAYIDFASKNGIEYVILDEGWAVNKKADLMQVVPEIDLPMLVKNAADKNVGLILWAGYIAFDRDMEKVVKHYADCLDIHYYNKPNSGPGQTRNYGAERSNGEYLIILDSDCILPEGYLAAVGAELQRERTDAFGGPDRAHESFSDVQKAINYAMTSFFTTGGISGGKKKMDKFYPRSFNMGVRAEVYKTLGGFSKMRFGEDIDFSIRIFKGGYVCRLFPEAWVWHKRRTDLKKFFKQVHNSGIARINLYKKYPESLKIVHLLPAVFTLGVLFLLLGAPICVWSLSLLLLFALIICIDSTLQNNSLKIGMLSIVASFIQLTGYGTGFLRAWWKRCVLKKDEFAAFEKNFYK